RGAQRVEIEGAARRRGEDASFLTNTVGPDYFLTLRIDLVAGRGFEDRDDETGAPVAVVNDTLARRYWGGPARALGKRIRAADGDWRAVVGVAADVKYSRIDEPPRPYVYVPFLQAYRPGMVLHVRGTGSLAGLVEEARACVAAQDGDLAFLYARPLAERIAGSLVFLNLTATMLFVFGVAGMALAALGTYGLVAYTVEPSTREVGIRMALRAPGAAIVGGFPARGLPPGTPRAALGVVGALGAGRLLRGFLFGVSPTDPASFALALAVVLGGVVAATIVPAARAARTSPLRALRHH